MTNQSEVARLRTQLEREAAAANWAASGLTVGAARHWFIQRRLNRIGGAQQQLATHIGQDASMKLVHDLFENAPDM